MIAVSSYRPFGQAAEIDGAQFIARGTWEEVFDALWYWSPYCRIMDSPKTKFTDDGSNNAKPHIVWLAALAGENGNPYAAILNADIQVHPRTKDLPRILDREYVQCGISRRVTPEGEWVDMGLDFFVATSAVWQHLAQEIPEEYRLGCTSWDTWVLAWMVGNYPKTCADLSPCKLAVHVPHGNRGDQSIDKPKDDLWLSRVRWPSRSIGWEGPVRPVFRS